MGSFTKGNEIWVNSFSTQVMLHGAWLQHPLRDCCSWFAVTPLEAPLYSLHSQRYAQPMNVIDKGRWSKHNLACRLRQATFLVVSPRKKLNGLSPRANYTDRRLSAKRLPTCADKGCHVVSVTDPYGRILSVFWTGAATFLSSSSSIVLTRLSGPRSRPTTFSFWQCRESNPGLRICSQELWPVDHRGGLRSPSQDLILQLSNLYSWELKTFIYICAFLQ
jgi:hypothetical protein